MGGLIGAHPGNGDSYSGMAPDTRLLNIKVGDAVGRADVSQVIAGIDWAVEHRYELGIKVINLSYGTDSTQPYVFDPLAHAAEVAWRKGIVVVASAGNKHGSLLAMPAADPYVIAVGALDGRSTVTTADDVLASFSSQGNGRRPVDLIVPGVLIQGLRVPGSYVQRPARQRRDQRAVPARQRYVGSRSDRLRPGGRPVERPTESHAQPGEGAADVDGQGRRLDTGGDPRPGRCHGGADPRDVCVEAVLPALPGDGSLEASRGSYPRLGRHEHAHR